MSGPMFLQMVLNGLTLSLVYVLIASGLTLIFGILRVVNFAHGVIYMLGAYAMYILFAQWQVNYALALVLSMLVVGLMGLVVERIFFRPVRGRPLNALIISLGLVLLLENFALIGFGHQDKSVPYAFEGVLRFLGTAFPLQRLGIAVASVVIVVVLILFVQKTRWGRAMRAVADNAEAAALQGISVDRISALVFGLGCALAGGAGALMASMFYVNPFIGTEPVLKAFVIITLGGLGSLPGAILGAFVLGFVESFAGTLIGGTIATMIFFIVLLLVVLVKPSGLLGRD